MKTRRPLFPPLLPALAAPLAAQIAPRPTPATADAVVTLSEFNVTATAPTEYAATESTTGTRVASKIRDLPFSVQTVTGEFMDDFNALEFREQLASTSNVVGWESVSTGYSVRGFDADVQLRNGFRRIGLIDKVNLERAEVIKGPAGTVLLTGTTRMRDGRAQKFQVNRSNVLDRRDTYGCVGQGDRLNVACTYDLSF